MLGGSRMRKLLRNTAERVAPGTMSSVRIMNRLGTQFYDSPGRFIQYEREIAELRREVDEIRRNHRRVAELYDAVFESAKANAAARGVAPTPDTSTTIDRLAGEFAERRE